MTSIQDRMRDAAAQQAYDLQTRNRATVDTLNLKAPQRAGQVIHLDDDTAIVEVFNLLGRTRLAGHYTVVYQDRHPSTYVTTLPLALLYAAQIMTGGRAQDDDYVYAARVLNITDAEESTP